MFLLTFLANSDILIRSGKLIPHLRPRRAFRIIVQRASLHRIELHGGARLERALARPVPMKRVGANITQRVSSSLQLVSGVSCSADKTTDIFLPFGNSSKLQYFIIPRTSTLKSRNRLVIIGCFFIFRNIFRKGLLFRINVPRTTFHVQVIVTKCMQMTSLNTPTANVRFTPSRSLSRLRGPHKFYFNAQDFGNKVHAEFRKADTTRRVLHHSGARPSLVWTAFSLLRWVSLVKSWP